MYNFDFIIVLAPYIFWGMVGVITGFSIKAAVGRVRGPRRYKLHER